MFIMARRLVDGRDYDIVQIMPCYVVEITATDNKPEAARCGGAEYLVDRKLLFRYFPD